MDILVLDTELNCIDIVDSYESLIWTDRYDEYGDFELYTTIDQEVLETLRQDRYILTQNSEHAMIIESIVIDTDIEMGDHIKISGKSLESILQRRIVWGRKTISGNLQNGVKSLLEDCIISPTDPDRKIDNFIFEESTDPAITSLEIKAQYTGDELYEIIHKICVEHGLGFKITLNDDKQFVFKLYAALDRSYNQTVNPYVVFSSNYDNIVNSNYVESKSALKTVTLIAGEGEGAARKFTSVGGGVGLNRRELFTDARDISSENNDGTSISDEDYYSQLEQRGREKLAENVEITSFEGEADVNSTFRYLEDFFVGDIVQIIDDYGHDTKVRIAEIVMSENEEGLSTYPTFRNILEGE